MHEDNNEDAIVREHIGGSVTTQGDDTTIALLFGKDARLYENQVYHVPAVH